MRCLPEVRLAVVLDETLDGIGRVHWYDDVLVQSR